MVDLEISPEGRAVLERALGVRVVEGYSGWVWWYAGAELRGVGIAQWTGQLGDRVHLRNTGRADDHAGRPIVVTSPRPMVVECMPEELPGLLVAFAALKPELERLAPVDVAAGQANTEGRRMTIKAWADAVRGQHRTRPCDRGEVW